MFKNQPLPSEWEELKSPKQLDHAWNASNEKLVALFKHSVRCSRSAFAKSKLEENYNLKPNEVKFYYLDLIAHREVSNLIEQKSGVRHQSPQLILLKNGKVVFHTSHEMIGIDKIKKHL